MAAGHRAYVVCPLVEGSENIQAKSATQEKERLEETVLAGLPIGLLHGQLKAADKEGVMAAFRSGELAVLVATTVVEVGVDVAEATVMVIEDADRFGIAQLHQLRGRVGRSDLASWCYLLSAGSTPDAVTRLEALEKTTDGFELAEVDLDLRGEGTILGARQKGRSDLKLASLRRGDRPLVATAREIAESLLADDPVLESTAGAGRRAPSLRGRGRSRLPAQELTRSLGPQLRCSPWATVRVIAGSSRGRRLRAPTGEATRPTSDRVRESIFDVLGSLVDLEGTDVVDLFAGSGALGIEALSRGAASVTFVDSSLPAVRAVEANVVGTGLEPSPDPDRPGRRPRLAGAAPPVRPGPVRPALRLRPLAGTARPPPGRAGGAGIGPGRGGA